MCLVSAILAVRPLPKGTILSFLLVGVFLALACPQPADAQLKRVIGGVGRTISDSWKRIVSEPQRFRIRPTLVIDPQRQAGDATALSADQSLRLVLAVHGDGAAHVWDLERGVRTGGQLGDIVAGIIRTAGRSAEIVAIHRDGSVSALRLNGEHRAVGAAIQDFDPRTVPTLSRDGTAMAFRARDGRWHVAPVGARPAALPKAAPKARPFLSPDGSTVVYRAQGGNFDRRKDHRLRSALPWAPQRLRSRCSCNRGHVYSARDPHRARRCTRTHMPMGVERRKRPEAAFLRANQAAPRSRWQHCHERRRDSSRSTRCEWLRRSLDRLGKDPTIGNGQALLRLCASAPSRHFEGVALRRRGQWDDRYPLAPRQEADGGRLAHIHHAGLDGSRSYGALRWIAEWD